MALRRDLQPESESPAMTLGLVAILCALFIGLNLLASRYLSAVSPAPPPSVEEQGNAVLAKRGIEYFRRLYPHKSDQQIKDIVRGQAALETSFEPFAEFRSPAISRPGYNIHEAGFRLIGSEQSAWPLRDDGVNIFVFGGSTTLGGGVNDEETIPANLQELLRQAHEDSRIHVYNFGVGAYFSSQEVTYFQNQLRYGNVPDIVIFIDGLNDFYFADGLTAASRYYRDSIMTINSLNERLGRSRGVGWHALELLRSLPLAKLGDRWIEPTTQIERIEKVPPTTADYDQIYTDGPSITDPHQLETIIRRYFANQRIASGVSEAFGIESVFIWQPVPLYQHNLKFHPFLIQDGHRRVRYGYPRMKKLVERSPPSANFAWCADLHRGRAQILYVDQVHYNPTLSRDVAECVSQKVMSSHLIEKVLRRKRLTNDTQARRSAAALN